ncbi:MAG TPA: hypothetical protein VGJ60_09975 [Chloroflexota bacterium]|jgi:hypothetical protein
MAISLLTEAAQFECVHAGHATPLVSDTRVTIMGAPVLTLASVCSVAGCSLPPQAGGPCATASWETSATRVTASGLPVLLSTSIAMTSPTETPLQVVPTQDRVGGE